MAKYEENRTSQTEILKLPYLVLVVSLLITLGATFIFYKGAQAKDSLRFESEVADVKNQIETLLGAYISLIKVSSGFVESTENLDRWKFGDFVKSLELNKNNHRVKQIGFIKRVSSDDLKGFTENLKRQDYTEFRVFPESESSEKNVVVFIEPLTEDDLSLIGFDMVSEPARREALEKARNSGEAATTGKVELMLKTDSEKPIGFLIFAPVYKGGNPQTPAERQQFLDGYVFSAFRADNFLQDVQDRISTSDIAVTVYDGESRPENILAQTGSDISGQTVDFKTGSEIEAAGRKWVIEFQTLPSFALKSSTGWTFLIFISGLIFSMLFFGITYLESNARAKAEKMSDDLRESEREKGFLLEREQIERRRAEEASKAKDEFISIVSHELRTPLNAIAGWTKILSSDKISSATKKQALQKIDKSLRAQTKIVEELLDFSQLAVTESALEHQKINFSEIFEEEFNKASATAEENGVLMFKENNLNGQKVSGDGERLRRVVSNLLLNAIKFTPDGGRVTAKVEERDSTIELIVNDTGKGISPDFLPHIFERFTQADSSTTRRHSGLGLGLAISRHIVKLHGGSIEAASEGEGKGSTFKVRLPCDETKSSREEI